MKHTSAILTLLALAIATAGAVSAVTIPVQLHGDDYHLQPERITVVAGTPLTFDVLVTANNTGAHSFVIEDTDVNTGPIAPGESRQVDWTPPEARSYAYYSDMGADRERGMEGIIIVQPGSDGASGGGAESPGPGVLAALSVAGAGAMLLRRGRVSR